MAATASVGMEEFLKLAGRSGLAEYADGKVVEKSMSLPVHGEIQVGFGARLKTAMKPLGGMAGANIHCRLTERKYFLPDIVAYAEPVPGDQYPSRPALVAVEIVSPSDSFSGLLDKCDEYAEWGVAHIWVIEPRSRGLYVFAKDAFAKSRLRPVDEFVVPEHGLVFIPADIFPD